MRINYKDKVYELAELTEPNKNETFDIIAIFEVKPCKWVGTDLVECSKDECEFEKLVFINYFYGSDEDDESLIEVVKEYIDRRDE